MELINKRKEKRQRIISLSSKAKELEQILFNDLRELAMFKTHANYWWYSHRLESSPEKYNERYYEEHLRSQSDARNAQKNIGINLSKYFGIVSEFLTLEKEQTVGIVTDLEILKKLTFKKAVDYDLNDDYYDVRENRVAKDEEELKLNYWDSLKPVSDINQIMYNKAKAHAQACF